jgi:sulfatase modifying factor 1
MAPTARLFLHLLLLGSGLGVSCLCFAQAEVSGPCPAQPVVGERSDLALVIGIKGYPHISDRLKYADEDAKSFASLIQTPEAGGFRRENVCLLVNDNATEEHIRDGITWLKRPGRARKIYVFFSGHALVDDQGSAYFMPWDGNEKNIYQHGWRLDRLVDDLATLTSRDQLIIFVDACHAAAGVGGGLAKGTQDVSSAVSAALNDKFEEYKSKNKDASEFMAFFSAHSGEQSIEDDELKHGTFTHFLLLGMQCEADKPPYGNRDGIVTAEELNLYVSHQVAMWVRQKYDKGQNPTTTSVFNPGFPIAACQDRPCGSPAGCVRNPMDGQRYVSILPGEFHVGCVPSDKGCYADEQPNHKVSISKGFLIGESEVTVGAYKRFIANTQGHSMPPAPHFNLKWSSEEEPIVDLNWYQAEEYCTWLGGHLPTEAEWEYAARAGQEYLKYPWGDPIAHDDANYGSEDGRGGLVIGKDMWEYTAPVRRFPANHWGLYDMAGNVWEWTRDCYEKDFYGKSRAEDPYNDPAGRSCDRVVRGGSWEDSSFYLRASMRNRFNPAEGHTVVGFRCVLPSSTKQRTSLQK